MNNPVSITNALSTLVLACMVVLLSACSNGDPNDPNGEVLLPGTLTGTVKLFDEYLRQESDHSGVLVSTEGKPYTTTSTADGTWTFEDLPTGTYVLSFTKDGYTTFKDFGVQFVGGGTVYYERNTVLSRIPSYTILDLTVQMVDTLKHGRDSTVEVFDPPRPRLFCTFSAEPPDEHLRNRAAFFLGRDQSVSKEPGSYVGSFNAETDESLKDLAVWLDKHLNEAGFQHGERVYVVGYPIAANVDAYFDPEQDRVVYTGISSNKSTVISFVWE